MSDWTPLSTRNYSVADLRLERLIAKRNAHDDATREWREALTAFIHTDPSADDVISNTGMSLQEIRAELTYYVPGSPGERIDARVKAWLQAA